MWCEACARNVGGFLRWASHRCLRAVPSSLPSSSCCQMRRLQINCRTAGLHHVLQGLALFTQVQHQMAVRQRGLSAQRRVATRTSASATTLRPSPAHPSYAGCRRHGSTHLPSFGAPAGHRLARARTCAGWTTAPRRARCRRRRAPLQPSAAATPTRRRPPPAPHRPLPWRTGCCPGRSWVLSCSGLKTSREGGNGVKQGKGGMCLRLGGTGRHAPCAEQGALRSALAIPRP